MVKFGTQKEKKMVEDEKHLIFEELKEYFYHENFVHIVCNSWHYNGWILDVDNTHIKFKDKKTNSIQIFRISNISVLELSKED